MFGLAFWPDYSYYFGHVMWDIETFAFPPFLLTAPDTARGLLDYRFTRLPAARLNASMQGYAGIQYPWESSADFGQESTPPDGQLLGMEQHVNLSVGLAFAQFCHASGDDEFARFEAWPVLRGIANWILSRVTATDRGLEIKNTIGIAENRGHTVDNDAYVNMAAIVVLDEAVMLGRKFGLPTESWAEASKRMFVPVNRRTGVIANHDRFTVREGGVAGATPEALAGFFPFGYRASAAVERATLAFYLGRVEPYVGYPMLSSLLGVYAARLGDRSRSTDLFEAGYAEFITPPFSETSEFNRVRFPDRPRVGPLFANLGGFLTSLIYGLPRIRLGPGAPDTWLEGPITMPSAWEGIEVDRVWVRGNAHELAGQTWERPGELDRRWLASTVREAGVDRLLPSSANSWRSCSSGAKHCRESLVKGRGIPKAWDWNSDTPNASIAPCCHLGAQVVNEPASAGFKSVAVAAQW